MAALPVFPFTRLTKKYIRIPVTAVLADGSVATITGVDVALVAPGASVSSSTTWTAATYTAGVAKVLLAAPDANPSGAIVVPAGGADVFARVTDSPEVDAQRIFTVPIT